jgi:hypothetical protein
MAYIARGSDGLPCLAFHPLAAIANLLVILTLPQPLQQLSRLGIILKLG